MRQISSSAVLVVLAAMLLGACATGGSTTASVGGQPAAAVAPVSSGELGGGIWNLEWTHIVTDGLDSGKYYVYTGQATLVRDGEVLRAKLAGDGISVFRNPISLWGTLEGKLIGQTLELSVVSTDRLIAPAKDRTCAIKGRVTGQANGPKIILQGKGQQSGPMDCSRSVDLEVVLTRRQ